MTLDQVFDLPTAALVGLGILVVVVLALLIVGVVAWAGTPEDRMPPPNKWLWLAIIVFLQILGPIAFLVLRRQHGRYMGVETGPAAANSPATTRRTATDAADLLYGGSEESR
ncbi:MAG: PLD nuclease N-terminal domain-containing protein [Actinomycetes bacterium]|nr:PLD nuclease N-terminal domain-containing protein [Actinomycetes bacterium]